MTRIVVDASITAAILFDDEASERDGPVWAALRAGELAIPAHWAIELISWLLKAERRGRMTRERRDEHFLEAKALLAPSEVGTPTMSRAVLNLAAATALSAYDAAYLDLALRLDATLATNNDSLIAVAQTRGVPVLTTRP